MRSKLAINTLIYIFSDLVVKAIPFFLIPIVTRYLSVEEYGQIAFYLTLIEVGCILSIMGSHSYYRYSYFKGNGTGEKDNLILLPVIISALVSIVIAVVILFLLLLGFVSQLQLLFLPVICFFQSCIALIVCKYQMDANPIRVGVVNLITALLSFSSTLLFLKIGYGVDGRLASIIATPIIVGAGILIYILRTATIDRLFISYHLSKCLIFGMKSIPTSVSWWLRSGMDRVIIQAVVGMAALGIYSVGMQLTMIVSVISLAINNSIMPKIFQCIATQNMRSTLRISGIAALVICGIAIGFGCISSALFDFILPATFLAAKNLVLPLLFGIVLHGYFLLIANIYTALHRPGILSSIALTCAALHVFTSYIMATEYGLSGLVWSSALTYAISVIWGGLLLYRITQRSQGFSAHSGKI